MTTEEKEKSIKTAMQDMADMGFRQMLLAPEDVAQILGVSISSLYTLRQEGKGIEYRKDSQNGKKGRIKYPARAVAEYIVSNIRKTA